MFNKNWLLALLISIILSFGLIWSAKILKGSYPNKITTKGYAERKIKSNFAIWQGRLNTRYKDLEEAFNQLSYNLEITKKFFKENGIQDKELTISPVHTSLLNKRDEHGNYTNTVEFYELHYDLFIHSENVERIANISSQVTQLIKQKISIDSYLPKYFYTKVDELKVDLLAEAAKDALARAKKLAEPTQTQITLLRSANQGIFQITPAYSTTTSDSGEYDISSIEKNIRAVVTMEYGIH